MQVMHTQPGPASSGGLSPPVDAMVPAKKEKGMQREDAKRQRYAKECIGLRARGKQRVMTRRCAAVHLDATSKVASLECSTKLRSRSGTAGAGGAAVVAGGAKRGPQRPVPLAAPH